MVKLFWRDSLVHPTFSGLPNPIHLSLRPELRLELGNGPEHVEQQASRRRARLHLLIEDLQVDLLPLEYGRDLAEMQGRAGEPIQTRHHEHVAFPDILETRG
jgi:hypothetical protein